MLISVGCGNQRRHQLGLVRADQVTRELESEFREWNAQLVAPLWSDAHTKHQIEDYRDLQETRRKALPRVNN